MPPKNYESVSLPKELVDEIKEFIEKYPKLGFKTVPEFIKHASREQLVRFKEYYEKKVVFKEETEVG
ncbi:hypothetical protein DRP07_00755 [Archaeoglobales archaeon]|nr:MAG: hypothetical protein DRP07_00755 [Archaeoglobales archaeon]